MRRRAVEVPAEAQARVSCPLRGGASLDVERCLGCAYFKGNAACGADHRDLIDAEQESWRRLLVP